MTEPGQLRLQHITPARVIGKASNSKLAPVELVKNDTDRLRPVPRAPFCAATYLPIEQTCPTTCAFHRKSAGGLRPCYASAGFTGPLVRRLEESAEGLSPLDVALEELAGIERVFNGGQIPQDGARGGRDLRLHVSGDARTILAAEAMGQIETNWRGRQGGAVWSYTHAWRNVPRAAWGRVSVLASIDRPEQAAAARAQGYGIAIVLRDFPSRRRFFMHDGRTARSGFNVIPCPAETTGTTCVQCRLCFDEPRLRKEKLAIGFQVHGHGSHVARRRLPVLGQTELSL